MCNYADVLVNFSKSISDMLKIFGNNKIWPMNILNLKFQINRTKIKHFTVVNVLGIGILHGKFRLGVVHY